VELRAYLAVARRWWWTLLAATVVAGAVGYLAARTIPPTYEAETKLLIGPVTNTDIDTIRAASSLAETYAELAHSDTSLSTMSAKLSLGTPLVDLRENVKVVADDVTRLISIRADAGDAQLAADMANELASQLQEVQAQGPARAEGEIHVIDKAAPAPDPIAPSVNLIAVMAAGAGLVAALILVLVVEHFSDTVGSRFELAEIAAVPYLGSIALPRRFVASPADPLAVEAIPESRTAVSTRLLASKISFSGGTPLRSVLIVGSQAGDRAPELAANIAAGLAGSGRKVVLVDANDIEGEITSLFSIDERTGVRELLEWPTLQTAQGLLEAVLVHREPGMEVLPHGAGGPQLIDRESADQLVKALLERGDLVIINSAPVHRSGSTLVWARVTDATLLVAHRDVSKRENVTYAVDSLRQVGANLIGLVLMERRWSFFSGSERPRRRDDEGRGSSRRGRSSGSPQSASARRIPPQATPTPATPAAERSSTGQSKAAREAGRAGRRGR
jgi:capsular polysaccharide biosynthesis protein/Mrp family chromosome partitioning ATPase